MEGVTSFYIIFHIEANFVLRRITDGIPAPTWIEIFAKLFPKNIERNFYVTWHKNKRTLSFPIKFDFKILDVEILGKARKL